MWTKGKSLWTLNDRSNKLLSVTGSIITALASRWCPSFLLLMTGTVRLLRPNASLSCVHTWKKERHDQTIASRPQWWPLWRTRQHDGHHWREAFGRVTLWFLLNPFFFLYYEHDLNRQAMLVLVKKKRKREKKSSRASSFLVFQLSSWVYSLFLSKGKGR